MSPKALCGAVSQIFRTETICGEPACIAGARRASKTGAARRVRMLRLRYRASVPPVNPQPFPAVRESNVAAPQPWLQGPLPGVHPLIAAVVPAFLQAREDLEAHTAGLSAEQVWAHPFGLSPLGFPLRH